MYVARLLYEEALPVQSCLRLLDTSRRQALERSPHACVRTQECFTQESTNAQLKASHKGA